MDYRFEKKDAFQVYGLEDVYTMDGCKNEKGKDIPEVWKEIMENGDLEKLAASAHAKPGKYSHKDWFKEGGFGEEIGVVIAYDSYKITGDKTFPYLIGCYKSSQSETDGYTVLDVPAATWVVFSAKRDESLHGNYDLRKLKQMIYSEWLPTSNHKMFDDGVFEMYCWDKDGRQYCELWYRVEEK